MIDYKLHLIYGIPNDTLPIEGKERQIKLIVEIMFSSPESEPEQPPGWHPKSSRQHQSH